MSKTITRSVFWRCCQETLVRSSMIAKIFAMLFALSAITSQSSAQTTYCTFDAPGGAGSCAFGTDLCADGYIFGYTGPATQVIIESGVTSIDVLLYYTDCSSGTIDFYLNGTFVNTIPTFYDCFCVPGGGTYPQLVTLSGAQLAPLTGGGADWMDVFFTSPSNAVAGVVTTVYGVAPPSLCESLPYCIPPSGNGCSWPDQISLVDINGISRVSGCDAGPPGWSLYTTPNPSFEIGVSYPYTIETSGDTEGYALWFDWNGDGDFDDTDEFIASGYAGTNPATYTGSATVSALAVPGSTRMRVRCAYAGVPSGPCDDIFFSETEDYCITIIPAFDCNSTAYCIPLSGNGCSWPDQISLVDINGIYRASGCDAGPPGWSLYTSPNPSFSIGGVYAYSIETSGDVEGYGLWFDWNRDGDFDDTDEFIASGYAGTNPATYSGVVTVPAGASLGSSRMRVRCSYAQAPTGPCVEYFFSETEDYCITIDNAPPPCFACVPGAYMESEVCGINYPDGTNGGCNNGGGAGPFTYEPLVLNTDNCGTAWFDGGTRDTDWWEFTAAGGSYDFTVSSEFPAILGFIDMSAGCPVFSFFDFAFNPACGTTTLTTVLPAGLWVAFVANDFSTIITCGTDDEYSMRVDGSAPSCIACPGGAYIETELCGLDLNGGCNMGSPTYEPLTLGTDNCGTGWFDGGTRDTDWWMFTSPGAMLTMTVGSAFPAIFGFVDLNAGCPVGAFYSFALNPTCVASSTLTTFIPAGTWVAFVANDFSAITTCGTDDNYTLRVDGPPPAPSCAEDYTITIAGGGFMDEVGWTLTSASAVVVASGGPYGFGSTNSVTYTASGISPDDGPFTFYVETMGTFNDNVITYDISCTSGSVLSGGIGGGTDFTSGPVCCTPPPSCAGTYTGTISSGAFLDEVSWTITSASANIVASGGPYGFGTSNPFSYIADGLNPNDGPFTFFIESMGTFNDNTPTFDVVCSGSTLVSGSLAGGSSFTSAPFCCGAVVCDPPVDFTACYDPSTWTFTNTNADGSVNTAGAPASIALTGGDDGSGLNGTSDYTHMALTGGIVCFDWSYSSTDTDPFFDHANFYLNGVGTNLNGFDATLGGPLTQSGTHSATVAAGDVFGFQVNTLDNIFGSASLTISNFSAPVCPLPGDMVCDPLATIFSGNGLFSYTCNEIFGSNTGATIEAGEPSMCVTLDESMWHKWTAPTCGSSAYNVILSTDNAGNFYDTAIELFYSPDGSCDFSQFVSVGCNDDDFSGTTGCNGIGVFFSSGLNVTGSIVNGGVYWIRVDGFSTADGAYDLTLRIEPVAPTLVAGPQPQTDIDASWVSASPNHYDLYWRLTGGPGYASQTGLSGTTYTIGNLLPGTSYEVQYKSVCIPNGIEKYYSTVSSITTVASLCTSPGMPTCNIVTNTSITIGWANVPLAVNYKVYKRNVGNQNWQIVTVPAGTLTKTFNNLNQGTTYEFKVKANCYPGGGGANIFGPSGFCTTLGSPRQGDLEAKDTDYEYTFNGVTYYNWSPADLNLDALLEGFDNASLEIINGELQIIGDGLALEDVLSLNIYPNPASTSATVAIELAAAGEVTISVFDVQGKLVKTVIVSAEGSTLNYTLSLDDLSAGMYNVVVQTGTDVQSTKLAVVR